MVNVNVIRKPFYFTEKGFPLFLFQFALFFIFSASVFTENDVFSFGSVNEHGILGLGHPDDNLLVPKKIESIAGVQIQDISCSSQHCLLLDKDGFVYSFGLNMEGKLGQGDLQLRELPTLISSLKNIFLIETSPFSSFCIQNGTYNLFGFGGNNYGQLGLGIVSESEKVPKLIPNSDQYHFDSISGSRYHTLLLSRLKGEVYCVGLNELGQCGVSHLNPVLSLEKVNVTSLNGTVISISSSFYHSLLLTSTGIVYGMGTNKFLGLATSGNSYVVTMIPYVGNNISFILASERGSHLIDLDGNGYAIGDNVNGMLGVGTFANILTSFTAIGLLKMKSISCANTHCLYIDIFNETYGSGANQGGTLGIGDSLNDRPSPNKVLTSKFFIKAQASSWNSLFLSNEFEVYVTGCWNWALTGQKVLRPSVAPLRQLSYPFMKQGKIKSTVVTGPISRHELILTTDGTVYSWGLNNYGQLGHGDFEDSAFPQEITCITGRKSSKISSAAVGELHSLLLNSDGNVYSFGAGDRGQLGHGDGELRQLPTMVKPLADFTIVKIVAGGWHSFVKTNTSQLYSFGDNLNGQLGISSSVPLMTLPTLLPFTKNAIDLVCSWSHCLILTESNEIFSFGANHFGELGIKGLPLHYFYPTPMQVQFPIPSISGNVILALGSRSSFVHINGMTFSFGMNRMGQLAVNDTADRYVPTLVQNFNVSLHSISCGDDFCLFLTSNHKLYHSGSALPGYSRGFFNIFSTPALVTPTYVPFNSSRNVVQISASYIHASLLVCSIGYTGFPSCQYPICFGISSNQSEVCNHQNGTCYEPDKCQCLDGYGGPDCKVIQCYGKPNDDKRSCSSRGTCLGPDNCACNKGYVGKECELLVCHGKNSSDARVCGGVTNGKCKSPDHCECFSNYEGDQCEFETKESLFQ